MSSRKTESISPAAGLVTETVALLSVALIAAVLAGDDRATPAIQASLWTALALAAAAVAVVRGTGRPAIVADAAAIVALAGGMIGSYEIGGLALLGPAFLFGIAAVLNSLATPQGARALGLGSGKPALVGGSVLAVLGAFLGMSMTMLAVVGWSASLAAVALLGRYLADRRRRRGARVAALGWVFAFGIVLAVNIAAWIVAITLIAIF